MRKVYIAALLLAVFLASCSLPVDMTEDNEPVTSTNSSALAETTSPDEGANGETKLMAGSESDELSGQKTIERVPVTVYYQDLDGCLVPVTRKVAKQEGIGKASIMGLVDSSSTREKLEYFGLYPVLPEGTEVRGLSIKEGKAVIDFNDRLLAYNTAVDEKNIVGSIVYTLTEFKTIGSVEIHINGEGIKNLRFGADISKPLNRENTLINGKTAMVAEGFEKTDVYLYKRANKDFTYLVPVSMEEPAEPDRDIPDKVVQLLVNKDIPAGFSSEIPEGVSLLKSSLKGDTLKLDFSVDLKNYGGTSREDAILKQLLLSMKQIKGVAKVQMAIEGKILELPEGTDLSLPIPIPSTVNDVIDG